MKLITAKLICLMAVAIPTIICAQEQAHQTSGKTGIINSISSTVNTTYKAVKEWITQGFTASASPSKRFLLALCLGLLLSLTPCIYPMIPVTIGILHIGKSQSTTENFIRALAYTLGISTTFAIFGFLAAIGGSVFGEFQSSPWFIIPLALLLLYFGLSFFDLWQIKMPTFFKTNDASSARKSPAAAFFFGLLSGTVASPCLSPGLFLILNYVAQLTQTASLISFLHGFALLFVFGIGSSLPLLLIGTFSTSLEFLPKAGPWMVEVKRLVGAMLIGMALYYLQHLFPPAFNQWLALGALGALALYYGLQAAQTSSPGLRVYRIAVAALLGITAVMTFGGQTPPAATHITWEKSYEKARDNAQQTNKLVLLNVGATNCATCKTISKAVFQEKQYASLLDTFAKIKIDVDVDKAAYEQVTDLYGSFIKAYPTILIVDPKTETVMHAWPQDNDVSAESLITLLSSVNK